MLRSIQSSTALTYMSGSDSWRRWCRQSGVSLWPVEPVHVALCLVASVQSGLGEGAVMNIYSGINSVLEIFTGDSLSGSSILRRVRKFIQRWAVKKDRKKEPFEYSDLVRLVKDWDIATAHWEVTRTRMAMVLSWFGFLRSSDMMELKVKNVTFGVGHVKLWINRSKTDPEAKGVQVVVAEGVGKVRPVAMLKKYMKRLEGRGSDWLFPNSRKRPKRPGFIIHKHKQWRYDCYRVHLKREMVKLGLDPKKFGTHSMRIGGCSEFSRRGVPEAVLDEHGRWKTASSRRKYQRILERDLKAMAELF